MRKSCYSCKYVGTERIADLTLADYWGVPENEITDQQRKYGVSLVLANSDKANELMGELEMYMILKEIEPTNAIAHNQALSKPSSSNPDRTKFFEKIDNTSFDKLIHRLLWKLYLKKHVRRGMIKFLGMKSFSKLTDMIRRR